MNANSTKFVKMLLRYIARLMESRNDSIYQIIIQLIDSNILYIIICVTLKLFLYTDKKMVLSSYNSRLMKVYSEPIA